MVGSIIISGFIFVWLSAAVLGIRIKKRLKEEYPEIHADMFAKSLIEHNVKKSVEFQSFALRSAKWSAIEDQQLILWLKLHRVCFFLLIIGFGGIFLTAFVGLIYFGLSGKA